MAEPASLCVKWQGQEYAVHLTPEDTVATVKHKLEQQTQVSAKRQKLLGLKTRDGKLAGDEAKVSDLAIKASTKVMMMGQREETIAAAEAEALAAPEVQDDFDLRPEEEQALDVKDQPEVLEKLQRRIRSVEVKVMNPPRDGKKCLVLDIDYTLFDLGSAAERPDELARPHLHEFLRDTYQFYDIIIWSATNMKWVEVKMRELGVLGNEQYKITAMLDHAAMVTVQTEKYGVFDCKPLGFIWAKFPDHYNAENTVMLDDLRQGRACAWRNFVMNKQQGLVIRPFKRAHMNRDKASLLGDNELLHLSHYLCLVGPLPSLADLNHRKWESYLQKHAAGFGGSFSSGGGGGGAGSRSGGSGARGS
ncbi:ubiquitin-like domain containing CTD phosphatase 1 [Monoraphidium neglectum]|uniref:protein-serine/threonine phosphatase n=1 Tax=Monoraphidium neglectum TaxID=145388 RepID=A0A0D2NQX6_9CHLO|nr:ubiquitin-like domain containing CTD phosphatase 1 [Monoraphidium neglectum]KIZ06716.1 ubiquitin-like domain containing CTD phosphatase 1 [Monoraphidium neglectum]|eukprot:XP_013905735.1 ubiquitin-like domain containing CTD phosphatase 1 [Monoraphidium neglectum]